MWEKLNKIKVQVIVAMVCVVGVFAILAVAMFFPIPKDNVTIVTRAIDVLLTAMILGVFGWLYAASKDKSQ